MTTQRWVLVEEATDETWTMTLNPNSMDALPADKALTYAYPSRNNQERMRSFQTPTPSRTHSWSGVLHTQAHYDTLRLWSRKPGVILITDHMDRSFRVLMQSFKPEHKAGRRTGDYRIRYTVTTQWLGRVS